jgi:hypothetical protein
MKKNKHLFLIILLAFEIGSAQVGIGTTAPKSSSVLDVSSTTRGLLIPRMTTLQRDAIASPAIGLMVYNTDDATLNTYNGSLGWQDFTARYKTITSNTDTTTASITDVLASEMTISPPEGNYMVSFNGQYKNNPLTTVTTVVTPNTTSVNTTNCFPVFTRIVADLDNTAITDSNFTATLGSLAGQTVYPGKYYIPAALALQNKIILNANGNENALFIFQAEGAINSSVFTTITLAGGAKACNVFWVALGAIGIGADCIIEGNLIARTAAIAVGFRSTLEGRMFSGGGEIAFGPGTASVPVGTSSIDLGILKEFVIYTHAGGLGNVISGSDVTGIYNGYILSDAGAATGFETATLQYPIIPAGGVVSLPDGTSTTTYVNNIVENTVFGLANFSIYSNGALVTSSTKTLPSSSAIAEVSIRGIVSVSYGQSVQIRWNTTAETLLMKNRTLTLVRVQ